MEVGEEGDYIIYLSLTLSLCEPFYLFINSEDDWVATRQCPRTTTFETKVEPIEAESNRVFSAYH